MKAEENAMRGKVKEKMNIDTLNLHCEKSDSFDISEDNSSMRSCSSVKSGRSSEPSGISEAPSLLNSSVTVNVNINDPSAGNINQFRNSQLRKLDQVFYNKLFKEKVDEGHFAAEDEVLTSIKIEELPLLKR